MKNISLNQFAPWTDDFFFMPYGEKDKLVICNPPDSTCESPVFLRSKKTLEKHIQLVNEKKIKKAMIVAEDIGFLRRCPSLEELHIIPSFKAQMFDFSPLYDMPNLRKLSCCTVYGPEEDRVSHVDYSKFSSLESLIVSGPKGHDNVWAVRGLKQLSFENGQPVSKTLVGTFQGKDLEELSITTSGITSLEGLQQSTRLKTLELSYNRRLEDISALTHVKDTLLKLDVENCARVKDFSVLAELHCLEDLRMVGNNVLPDLSFVRNMPNLKSFIFMMNVENGDLSMCLGIPYVAIKNRKHYSHKDKDFSKLP